MVVLLGLVFPAAAAAPYFNLVIAQVSCAGDSFASVRVCQRYQGYLSSLASDSGALYVEIPANASLPLQLDIASNAPLAPLLVSVGPSSSVALALLFNATTLPSRPPFGPDGYLLRGGRIPVTLLSSSTTVSAVAVASIGGASELLQTEKPATIYDGCPRGNVYGAYALLEEALGFAFLKPTQPMIGNLATANGTAIESLLVLREGPYWPVRMWHYHTQHPLELTEVLNGWGHSDPYDGQSWEKMLPEVDSFMEWLAANGQNRWEFVLLEAESWKAFSRSKLRASRVAQIGVRSREFCIAFGIDAPIAFLQQHSFTLITDLSRNASLDAQLAQIRASIDYLHSDLGIDFLGTENGLSEFSHAACSRVLAWMNETANYALQVGLPSLIKCHCSTGQSCPEYLSPQTGLPINFNFLPQLASPSLGVMPHTVQFYGLNDPAPVYNNQNFTYMLDWMFLMTTSVGEGRTVLYYPETEYWVDFDSSVPLFLPLYGERRLSDLRLIARRQLDPNNGTISGQNTFDSGWEWSYWLNSAVTARAVYSPITDDLSLSDQQA
ncbi:MAG: hypothetical protein Q8P67_15060, partial [archaeon]|nr:hypothetical protein [archaeon]